LGLFSLHLMLTPRNSFSERLSLTSCN